MLFMGLERLEQLCRGLVAAGLPAVDAGGGRLARHAAGPGVRHRDARRPRRARCRAPRSPALVVVGDVVALAASLAPTAVLSA